MGTDEVVRIMRQTVETAFWMGAPLLIIATVVGLLINIAQVLTSLQETTIATVPKLFAVALAAVVLMPWMTHRLAAFTLQLLSDFRPFAR